MPLTFDEAHFDRAAAHFERRLKQGLPGVATLSARSVVARTTARWPVDTGASRDGWWAGLRQAAVINGRTYTRITVPNTVSHAVFVEYGTSKQPPAGILQSEMRAARMTAARRLGRLVLQTWSRG